MVRQITFDLRRAVYSWQFAVSMLFMWCILLEPVWGDITNGMGIADNATMFSMSINISMFPIVAPIFCCLPFSSSYVEDKESGVLPFYWTRIGYRSHTISRCIAVFISGAFVMFITLSMYALFLTCLLKAFSPTDIFMNNPMKGTFWESHFNTPGGYSYIVHEILLITLFGGVWATLGMCLGVMSSSRFASWAGPFAIYFTVLYFSPAIGVPLINPGQLIVPSYGTSSTLILVVAYEIIVLFISLYFIHKKTRREKT